MKEVKVLKFRFLLGIAATFLPLVAAAATTHIVTVADNSFSPSSLTIQVGDTVEWRNAAGGMSHNVTDNAGNFNSVTASSFTFDQTFTQAGTVNYHCTIHPNSMKGTITVQGAAGAADLAVQSVDATNGTYAPGDSIPIDISIQNMGNAASATYTVTFYASTDSTINSSDTEIGSSARAALDASQTSNFSINAAFPASIAIGSYFIGAIIEISDTNSANNTGHDNTAVTVASPAAAELVLTEVRGPFGSLPQGAIIPINAIVSNTGTAESGPFPVNYYASTDNSISAQDRLLGTENRASIAAGGVNPTRPINVRIPADLAPGTYFTGAIVDFTDSNSADNINFDRETITVTAAGTFVINNGLNDTWKNIGTPRQGFFITVFPDIVLPDRPEPVMFLAWFTYDVERPAADVTAMLGEPGHRWLTAFGPYSGDTATLDIELTQGGIFDSGVPAPTQTEHYGTITVRFTSCSEGVVSYDIPSVGVSSTLPIIRVAPDNVVLCEALSPP